MQRLPPRAIPNLVPARSTIGDHQRVFRSIPYGRQKREFAHAQRHVDRIGSIPESPGHAAATRLNRLDGKIGHKLERVRDGPHHVEGFLVAMAVQQSAFGNRPQRQRARA